MSSNSPSNAALRRFRILLDVDRDYEIDSRAKTGPRRFTLEASTLTELKTSIFLAEQNVKESEEGLAKDIVGQPARDMELEWFDPHTEAFVPLPTTLTALPSLVRLRWKQKQCRHILSSSSSPDKPVLALPGRRFPLDLDGEGFPVLDTRIFVNGVANSGLGTGLTTWDGAVVLSKYLIKQHTDATARSQAPTFDFELEFLKGKKVVELGAGTGLVGLSCAVLGAREVILTDLPYAVENLNDNVRRNVGAWRGLVQGPPGVGREEGRVTVEEGDWWQPPASSLMEGVDVVVAADVVWLDELVPPLGRYLATILMGGGRGEGRDGGREGGKGGERKRQILESSPVGGPSAGVVVPGLERLGKGGNETAESGEEGSGIGQGGKGGEEAGEGNPKSRKEWNFPVCFMAYQSRSAQTDALLMATMRQEGLVVEEVPAEAQDEQFRAPGVIHVYKIRAETG